MAHWFLRGLLLSTTFHSALLFAYVMARIVINSDAVNLEDPFFYDIPQISFLSLGIMSLAVCIASLLAAYYIFWRSSRSISIPPTS